MAVLPGADPHARDGAGLERPGDRRALRRARPGADAAATVWHALREEHERCVERVHAITGHERLGDPSPDALERHRRRQPWLDVLSYMQIDLLRRHRDGDETARKPLMATVAGVATGLRRTG